MRQCYMSQRGRAATRLPIVSQHRSKTSETQIKALHRFERRKEHEDGAVCGMVLLLHDGGLSAIAREGNDTDVILGAASQGLFRIGHAA
jgi:hypothetical protein